MFPKVLRWTVVLAVVAAVPLLVLVQCGPFWEKPGEGEKAKAGFKAGAPVIAALEAWREKHGDYPDALEAMIPDNLTALPSAPEVKFFYLKDDKGPHFIFRYEGPGANQCHYTPGTDWVCGGLW